jgi:hypothetical protein
MTKVIAGAAIALIAGYALAQGISSQPGRYQIAGSGSTMWRVNTGTGELVYCQAHVHEQKCFRVWPEK